MIKSVISEEISSKEEIQEESHMPFYLQGRTACSTNQINWSLKQGKWQVYN